MPKNELSRRRLFKNASLIMLAAAIPSVTLEASFQDYYHGPLINMDGLPFIDGRKFFEITSALENCSYSLLQMVARDLKKLKFASQNPPEFPSWIDKRTIPLVIVRNSEPVSFAVFHTQYLDRHDNQFNIRFRDGQEQTQREINSLLLGIHLGVSPRVQKSGPLAEGLFLAKEYLTHMISLRMQTEWWDFIEKNGLVSIRDLNGNPINEPGRQMRIGATAFIRGIGDEKRMEGAFIDAFPVLVVSFGLNHLFKNGDLSVHANGINSFRYGSQIIERDYEGKGEVVDILRNFINNWQHAGSLIPPVGSTLAITANPALKAALELKEKMGYYSSI